ncbi:MAG TPA: hypothetical protein GX506_03505 [Firmicutes bacterium]|nr:hypothetical protein [Bacillota bacterium]
MLDKLLLWALFAVPEGLMMVMAGLGFLGVRRSFRQIGSVGLMVGTTTVVARSLLPSGYHIPVVLLLYCALAVLVLRVSIKTAIFACFICIFSISLGQILIASPILRMTGLPFQATISNTWLNIAFGWLGDTILLAGAIFVTVRKGVLIPVPESEEVGGVEHR